MQNLNFEVIFIDSLVLGGFEEQVESIFNQFIELPENKVVVKLTLFNDCSNNQEYSKRYDFLQNLVLKHKLKIPVALICQPPTVGKPVLEVFLLDNFGHKALIKKGTGYLSVCLEEQEFLFASVTSFRADNLGKNAEIALHEINSIMQSNGFEFNNVVRQWNYIENILEIEDSQDKIEQNYQVFNNCRSKKYALCNFDKGYPVATGIGTIAGGCCVEIIALKGNKLDLVPIGNKRQIDAHRYSENVLIGNQQPGLDNKTTPKFERAKLVNNSEISVLLVSGTASIIGEKTVCLDDPAGQTITTIENIRILLKSSKQSFDFSRSRLLNYRAYVKYEKDVEAVKRICLEKFANSPGIILISDICRDDLLVEIECNYLLHN